MCVALGAHTTYVYSRCASVPPSLPLFTRHLVLCSPHEVSPFPLLGFPVCLPDMENAPRRSLRSRVSETPPISTATQLAGHSTATSSAGVPTATPSAGTTMPMPSAGTATVMPSAGTLTPCRPPAPPMPRSPSPACPLGPSPRPSVPSRHRPS